MPRGEHNQKWTDQQVLGALRESGGSFAAAARALGAHESTVRDRAKRYRHEGRYEIRANQLDHRQGDVGKYDLAFTLLLEIMRKPNQLTTKQLAYMYDIEQSMVLKVIGCAKGAGFIVGYHAGTHSVYLPFER